MRALPAPLLLITDRHQAVLPMQKIAEEIGRAGGCWLLLRDKDMARSERSALAVGLAHIARRHGMCLSVSADIELAAEIGAGGLHLQSAEAARPARKRLGSSIIIGVSAHSLAAVRAAQAAGADYVTLSPIFETTSKPGHGPALGTELLFEAAAIGIPVLALGGIQPERVASCRRANAAGIAVMGGVMRSGAPGRMVRRIMEAIETSRALPA